jgi:hypothetical protein
MTSLENTKACLGTNSRPEVWTDEEVAEFWAAVEDIENPTCSREWCSRCRWHEGCRGSLAI